MTGDVSWPGSGRVLAAFPDPRTWSVRSGRGEPRDHLYAEILSRQELPLPDPGGAEATCLDTAMLGDCGQRLAAIGVSRLLVVPDPGGGEGAVLLVENPDPVMVPLGSSRVPGGSGARGSKGILLDQLRPLPSGGGGGMRPSLSEVWALRRWTSALFKGAARPVHRQQGPLELVRQLGVDVAVVLSPCAAGLRATWASSSELGEQTFDGYEPVAALGQTGALGPILANLMSGLTAPPRTIRWQFARSSFGPLVLAISPPSPDLAMTLELVCDFMQFLEERFAVEYESRTNSMLLERARIAAMIHDSITQQVTNVSTQLQLLEVVAHDPERFQKMLSDARAQVGDALDDLRRSIYDLVPNGPGGEDLVRGVRRFLEGYVAQWGLDVRFATSGTPEEVGPEQSGLIFSFVQECLTNVRKHAGARTARVQVEFGDAGLMVRISDDGSGFDPAAVEQRASNHMGLHLLRTRAELLAATMTVRSLRGQGSSIELALPGPVWSAATAEV